MGDSKTAGSSVPALRRESKRYDVLVAGGGMAGVGAAVTAARHGARVALVQDRPVLGGNGSKEIRVNLGGACGGNACWWRETGLIEDLVLENQYRNPESNAELWDIVLQDLVRSQKGLDLYLNTPILDVRMAPSGGKDAAPRIQSVQGVTLRCEIATDFEAEYFIDCTGDGTMAYLAGAPFMSGHDAKGEFGESLAPEEHRRITLGTSSLIWAKDVGHPVEFHPPSFAYKFTEKDFRSGRVPVWEVGGDLRCGFWWLEWGGMLDTIHDDAQINFEILRIAYGVYDFLKNDPSQREKNRNLTLEFVTAIGGKRESRRFIGDHVLTEQDVVQRPDFPDAVAYGGWNMDDHAPKGFFDEAPPSFHRQIPGLYNIPLRCLYSKTVPNLLFAGRNASVTHVALTTTRLIITCCQMGEAAGAAAWLCIQKGITPRQLANGPQMAELRERLLRDDHYVVGARSEDSENLARPENTTVAASSQLPAAVLDQPDRQIQLDRDAAIIFPALAGELSHVDVLLTATADTRLGWQLHRADGRGLTIPVQSVAEGSVAVAEGGTQWVRIPVAARIASDDWHMLELKKNPAVSWHATKEHLVGLHPMLEHPQETFRSTNLFTRFHRTGRDWSWCVRLPADARTYAPENAVNGWSRPFLRPNLWASRATDFSKPEWLETRFKDSAPVRQVMFLFDSDLQVRIFNLAWLNRQNAMADLVKDYDVQVREGGEWRTVCEVRGNYQRRRVHTLDKAVTTDALRLVVRATNGTPRAQVYEVRAYAEAVLV